MIRMIVACQHLVNFAFPLICRLLIFFFRVNFFANSFRNTIRVSNSLDPDQKRSGLIWVQTVCQSYLQATLAGKELTDQYCSLSLCMLANFLCFCCRLHFFKINLSGTLSENQKVLILILPRGYKTFSMLK